MDQPVVVGDELTKNNDKFYEIYNAQLNKIQLNLNESQSSHLKITSPEVQIKDCFENDTQDLQNNVPSKLNSFNLDENIKNLSNGKDSSFRKIVDPPTIQENVPVIYNLIPSQSFPLKMISAELHIEDCFDNDAQILQLVVPVRYDLIESQTSHVKIKSPEVQIIDCFYNDPQEIEDNFSVLFDSDKNFENLSYGKDSDLRINDDVLLIQDNVSILNNLIESQYSTLDDDKSDEIYDAQLDKIDKNLMESHYLPPKIKSPEVQNRDCVDNDPQQIQDDFDVLYNSDDDFDKISYAKDLKIRQNEQSRLKDKWKIIGEMEIDQETWKKIFNSESGSFFSRIWTSPFAEELSKMTGCVVNFKGKM